MNNRLARRAPWKSAISMALALLAPSLAFAQSTILQAGPITSGHVMQYVGDGFSQPIVMDAGGAGGGGLGANTAELGITSRAGHGAYTPPYASNGNGPLGEHFCMFDGPTDNPTGYHYLCLDPNAQGGGLLDFGAAAGALQLPLAFIYNGTTYNFPFAAGGIVGPGTTTAGDIAIWNNTTGTLLKDVAVLPTINGGTGTANPAGIPEFNGVSAPTFINPGSGVATAIGVNTNASGGMTLVNGSPTIGDCLRWSSTGVQDAGGACSGGGGMIYPGAGVAVSTGSAWGTSINLGTGVSPALGVNTNASTGIVLANNSPTLVPGHCLQWSSTGVQDAGGACTTGGGGGTVSSGSTNNLAYYSTAGTTVTGLATANNGVLVTSSGGAPSISTTLPSGLTAPSFTVTTTFTATGLVTNADLVYSSTTVNGQSCTLGSTCTVAAAAGTLTGATLASGVTGSSLTSAAGGAFGTGAYATAYVLPTATNSVLGGVKPDGTTLANTSGAINVNLSHANTWLATQTFPSASITLAELATQTANTVLANATAGAASPTAVSMPSCSAGSSALTWTTSTGFGCNTITSGGLSKVYDITAYGCTTGSADNSACMQSALNAAHASGGGTVWVPAGYWVVKAQLTVYEGTKLIGTGNGNTWNPTSGLSAGSVIDIEWGSCTYGTGCSTTLADAGVIVQAATTVDSIGFDYPTQVTSGSTPVEWGATISCYDTVKGAYNVTITNDAFNKSYVAIDCRGSLVTSSSGAGEYNISYDVGCPIFNFLKLDNVVDYTFIQHLNFKNCASASGGTLTWTAANGVGIWVGNNTGVNLKDINMWGFFYGVEVNYSAYPANGCGQFTLSQSNFDATFDSVIYIPGSGGACNFTMWDIHHNYFAPLNLQTNATGTAFLNGSTTGVANYFGVLKYHDNIIYNYSSGAPAYIMYLNNGNATVSTLMVTNNYAYSGVAATICGYQMTNYAATHTLIFRDNQASGWSSGGVLCSGYTATNSDVSGNFY